MRNTENSDTRPHVQYSLEKDMVAKQQHINEILQNASTREKNNKRQTTEGVFLFSPAYLMIFRVVLLGKRFLQMAHGAVVQMNGSESYLSESLTDDNSESLGRQPKRREGSTKAKTEANFFEI